jgi:uncharacterized protein YerC
MPKPKIDRVKLDQLLRSGKSQKEVAQVFNVSEAAISKAKKELNLAVVKNVSLKCAHKIVGKSLDTIEQLQKINSHANWLLDVLMKWNKGDAGALQILESQVSTRRVRVGEKEEFVREFKFKDPRELALHAMQEIRGQLKLQMEIFQTLYDMNEVLSFQREVLEVIGDVSKEIRGEIVKRLKERRALRSAVEWSN